MLSNINTCSTQTCLQSSYHVSLILFSRCGVNTGHLYLGSIPLPLTVLPGNCYPFEEALHLNSRPYVCMYMCACVYMLEPYIAHTSGTWRNAMKMCLELHKFHMYHSVEFSHLTNWLNEWACSTVHKNSKPHLRTLGNNPRDTLPTLVTVTKRARALFVWNGDAR